MNEKSWGNGIPGRRNVDHKNWRQELKEGQGGGWEARSMVVWWDERVGQEPDQMWLSLFYFILKAMVLSSHIVESNQPFQRTILQNI